MSLDRLDSLTKALRRLPALLTDATADVVRHEAHVLEDTNTAQLSAGLDADGQPIRPEYAPLTVEIKQAKGQVSDHVTLRDTGDFYSSIVAQLRGDTLTLEATDEKAPGLLEKYGEEILGVPDAALEEFRQEHVLPELQLKAREALGL